MLYFYFDLGSLYEEVRLRDKIFRKTKASSLCTVLVATVDPDVLLGSFQSNTHQEKKEMEDEEGNPTNEQWIETWKGDTTEFHLNRVHPSLEKHVDELTGGKPNQRIFVPLCGKSLDILWLAERGHSVVGAEISGQAIKSFFEEHNLKYTREAVPMETTDALPSGAAVYKATERDITLFECDIFKLTSNHTGGTFDALHDIGAFVALMGKKQTEYVQAVTPLLAPHGRWLIETYDWDQTNPVAEADLTKLFSGSFNIRLVEKRRFTGKDALPTYGEDLDVMLFV